MPKPYSIFITGHRPIQKDKEGNWISKLAWDGVDGGSPVLMWRLVDMYEAYFKKRKEEVSFVISGMADGADISAALGAIRVGIPVHAYVPYRGHEQGKSVYKEWYNFILINAAYVNDTGKPYSDGCLTQRNLDMIKAGDKCLPLWDGTWGGTAHCVNHAKKMGKEVLPNLYPSWAKYGKPQEG